MQSNWERTGKILHETFALAKKDKSLYLPPILNLIVSMAFIIAAVVVLVIGSSLPSWDGSIPPAYLALALFLIFLSYVASAFFAAALSWMTLEVVRGKDTELMNGLGRAFKKTGSLLIYAGISFVVMLIANQLRRDDRDQSFIVVIIKRMFASMLEEAWDIASHLLLPAIVLTNNNFGKAVKEMPGMVKRLPQVLVGGFAFDFVVGWIYLLEAIVCFLLFLVFGWAAVVLFLLLFIATYIFYSFIKSVYFTMLYIDMHPELKRK